MTSANVHPALLVVIGEPAIEQHVGSILHRVIDGLSAWNHSPGAETDLNTELRNFLNTNVPPEHLETGGTVLRYSGSTLYVEILVNPGFKSLRQSLLHFLTLGSSYKHIIHAGAAFAGNGSWILQDGSWSMQDFSRLLHEVDVTTALTQIAPGSTLVVSCFPEGEWNDNGAKHHGLDKLAGVHLGRLSGDSRIDPSCAADLQAYFQQYIIYTPLEELMPASNVVGSIRFRRPTLHIFPAGQGDAALLGVSGFTILFDGGFSRKTCFWDFLRHVDRVDALLMSRLSNNNIIGISSFIDRLSTSECHPKLGYVFGNIPAFHRPSTNGEASRNPLLLSVHEEGTKINDHLAHLSLKPHPAVSLVNPTSKHQEPLTLYQKVGQGRLDMYILNPGKDSKELNEFLESWKKGIYKQGSSKFSVKPGSSVDFAPPLTDQTSIAALLVWRPADPNDQIVRVLYPGSCSQEKILSSLDKLKHLDILKHSTCTAASLEGKGVPSASAVPKKPLGVKAVENAARTSGSVSPKAAVAPKGIAATAPKTATSAAAAAAHPVTAAPAAPKAAESIAQVHHHVQSPEAQPMHREPDLFELSPIGEPLVDVAPPSMPEMSPNRETSPAEEDIILQESIPIQAQSPVLEPEHLHQESPRDLISPEAEPESFIHREQIDAVAAEGDLLDMEREHAGFGIAAEPTHASPFEAVDIGHTAQAGVLRLSHDQLHDYHGVHSRPDVVEEPSPVSPDHSQSEVVQQHHHQPLSGSLLDSPLEGRAQFEHSDIRAPAEPVLHGHPDSLPVQERSIQGVLGLQSPESPLQVAEQTPGSPQQPHSPRTQQRLSSLNPEAPIFIPKQSDLSPSAEPGFDAHPMLQHHHHEHSTSPMDPFSEKGFGDGAHGLPHTFDAYRNGSNNPFEDNAWPTGAAAVGPFGDGHAGPQSPSEGTRKKVEDAMKDWGEPLGLPAPAPAATNKGPQHGSATKPKANGPAGGAAKDQANKSSSGASATTTKRTVTTVTTTRVSSASGPAAAKTTTTTTTTESKAASAAAKKSSPTAPAKAAPPTPRPAAAKPAPSAAKPTPAAKSSLGTATAPKPATAAPAKSAPVASKKPAVPGAVHYVDLTYIPHQGNPHYVTADFFKHIRSKHYVLSTLHPSKEILEALLVGKKAWNLPEEEVTLIPTYDSDTLNLWMALHKDELASESIDVAPSCCRCTVNLEEHQGAKCAAYRLEL